MRATGGDGGAGIGGGDCGAGGSITISDGDVVARGTGYGAGIGGGRNKIGGTITITGGHVDAAGDALGAGIGGGSGCVPGTISISGGIVMAVGGTNGCAGVGSGYEGYTYAGTGSIRISGGTIYASGSRESPDIGRRSNEHNVIVAFTGGAIYVDKEKVQPDPKDGFEKRVFPVDLDIGLPNSKVTEFELGTRNSGFENIYTNDRGILRIWLASSIYSYGIRITMEDGSEHVFSFKVADDGTVTSSDFLIVNEAIITGDEDLLATEWTYTKSTSVLALLNNATVSGVSTSGTFRIVVADDRVANLTLKDLTIVARSEKYASAVVVSNSACAVALSGDNVIAAKGQYAAGVEVGSAGSLTIRGDGSLSATGGQYGAGIGSSGYDKNNPSGKIAIEGGTVVAQGGEKAAGIGGGSMANLAMEGNIVISGGNVTATGGKSAAGIGSGYMGGGTSGKTLADGAVKISGGTVLATKGANASSDLISSGNSVSVSGGDKALCITGGSVHGANNSAAPDPVDADGTSLRYWLFTGMAPGVPLVFESGIPENYGTNAVVADATGSVCLWLPYTNGVRKVSLNGQEFVGGGSTNNVFASTTGGVTVNGTNIAVLSGDGWTFSTDTRIVSLSGVGPFAISGEGTNVCIRADADCAVTLANLSITNDEAGLVPFDCGSHIVAMTLSGTNLLAASGENAPGIRTVPGASLVLAEAAAGGALFAQGGEKAAGIGGGNEASGGTITITGGDVTAAGGQFATGIGGGYIGFGGTISISGGTVAATGGDYGAGIGGGYALRAGGNADGGDITISGGTVTATGGGPAAGIGGGFGGAGGRIAITGGAVTATGGGGGAGIGGGYNGAGGTIRISDGADVAATGGNEAAGIGGGFSGSGDSVTISGGVVTATGGQFGAGVGGGYQGAAGEIEIAGGRVAATSISGGAAIGGGRNGQGGSVAIRGGTVSVTQDYNYDAPTIGYGTSGSVDSVVFTGGAIYTPAARVSPAATNDFAGAAVRPADFDLGVPNAKVESLVIGTPPLAYGANDLYTDAAGILRLWLPDGVWLLDLKLEDGDTERWVADVNASNAVTFRYLPSDPVGFTVNGTDVGEVMGDGWHHDTLRGIVALTGVGPFELSGTLTNATVAIAANCAVTLSNAVVDASAVTDAGAIHLASGVTATLSLVGENAVTGGVGRAGLSIPAGTTLTLVGINADAHDTLFAVGGEGAAGIGGDDNSAAGTIRIQGGTVVATGGAGGAGIGSGDHGSGGSVEISGGVVTAVSGGEDAYAIGSGAGNGERESDFGFITISGGTIFLETNLRNRAIGSIPDVMASNYHMVYIRGGSVWAGRDTVSPDPRSYDHTLVFPVDVDIGRPDSPVTASTSASGCPRATASR